MAATAERSAMQPIVEASGARAPDPSVSSSARVLGALTDRFLPAPGQQPPAIAPDPNAPPPAA
ncbi:hypothetical protein GCM10010532_061100 [Dactylosporangium siamense]